MDGRRKIMDNPNMYPIPTYSLYGEDQDSHVHDWLHWETIPARAKLHGFRISPHRHDHLFQLLHLTHGQGVVTIDDAAHLLLPGAMAVLSPLAVHGFDFSQDVDGAILTLRERDLQALRLELPPAGILSPEAAQGVVKFMDDLIVESDQISLGHDIAMQARIALLVVALMRARDPEAPPADPQRDPARAHARAFRALVDHRFRDSRSVAHYAQSLGISQTHLGRISREVLGASPLAVIERRIALEARRMLLFSNLSVKEIGVHLGYDDPGYFSRMLARVLGQSPRAFRQAASAAPPPRAAPPASAGSHSA